MMRRTREASLVLSFLLAANAVLAEGQDVYGAMQAAYNDDSGVTAEFNLNLLRRLNREIGADFQLDAFDLVFRPRHPVARHQRHRRFALDQAAAAEDDMMN